VSAEDLTEHHGVLDGDCGRAHAACELCGGDGDYPLHTGDGLAWMYCPACHPAELAAWLDECDAAGYDVSAAREDARLLLEDVGRAADRALGIEC
jgi:hypothetical protein